MMAPGNPCCCTLAFSTGSGSAYGPSSDGSSQLAHGTPAASMRIVMAPILSRTQSASIINIYGYVYG